MFERFTDRARRAIVLAQEEAKRANHDFIRPEHLLLALTQGDGVAGQALGQLGVSTEDVRARIGATVGSSGGAGRDKIPFSPAAKRALERSLRQALRLGHNYIGTEHLALGAVDLLEEGNGTGAVLGVSADEVRSAILAILPAGTAPEARRELRAAMRRARLRVQGPGATSDVVPQSAAATAALRRARQLATGEPMTTGHLLRALVEDSMSQAAKALAGLGVAAGSVEERLASVPVQDTSDAPPRPQLVEIKLGEATTTIGDPELAAALGALSADDLRKALRDAAEAARRQENDTAGGGAAGGGAAGGGAAEGEPA